MSFEYTKELSNEIVGLHRAAYDDEHERKDRLQARTTFPVATLTVLVSATLFFIARLKIEATLSFGALALSLLVSSGFVCKVFFHLVQALRVEDYRYLPPIQKLDSYLQDLCNYNKTAGDDDKTNLLEEKDASLRAWYTKCNEFNIRQNDIKSGNFVKALRSSVWAAVALATASILFYISQYNRGTTASKVEIVNLQDLNNEQRRREEQPAGRSDSSEAAEARYDHSKRGQHIGNTVDSNQERRQVEQAQEKTVTASPTTQRSSK